MPNFKDIQRRIGSVQKTQQITRAMRMVAGAKLRRAQEAITAARPYAERMRATLAEVARSQPEAEHPLLVTREVKKAELVVVTSDRGLCGAFNSNIIKQADAVLSQREAGLDEITITTAGRKVRDAYKNRRASQLGGDFPQEGWVTYGVAAEIAARVSERFLSEEIDEVLLVYSEFRSVMTQTPSLVRLLPFAPEEEPESESLPYTIEPDAAKLLSVLVPRALEVEIYRALLENQAGEHAARMTAMESATRNTQELIDSLTLKFNRARQAAITKELVEIVSGAEAL